LTCKCHGLPAYWQKDAGCKAGGWWRCAEKKKACERNRYDNDPIHRIEKNLHDHARRRRQTIDRRRADLVNEQRSG
jgi:hypothetical protein